MWLSRSCFRPFLGRVFSTSATRRPAALALLIGWDTDELRCPPASAGLAGDRSRVWMVHVRFHAADRVPEAHSGGTLAHILTDFSEKALIEAIDQNSVDFFMRYGRGPGCEFHDEGDLEWFTTGIPHHLFNGVMAAHLEPEDVDRRIDVMLAEFRTRELPLEWNVGALSTPPDLGRHLEAKGLEHTLDIPGMAVDLRVLPADEPPPDGLTISLARSRRDLETCIRIANATFGIPETFVSRLADIERSVDPDQRELTRHYLGRIHGKPAATSELFLSAGVAGLYFVGTLDEVRGRGLGRAMTLAGFRQATEMAYRIGVLHATTKGMPVYRRLGFREYCRIELYAVP